MRPSSLGNTQEACLAIPLKKESFMAMPLALTMTNGSVGESSGKSASDE